MSDKSDGNQNIQSAKVLQLGFNISVSGDPDTDFQIVLYDKGQRAIESSQNKSQGLTSTDVVPEANKTHDIDEKIKSAKQEVEKSTGAIPKQTKHSRNVVSMEAPKQIEAENVSKDSSIIYEIKNTMEHFEKFSDHIKEIPRLRNYPIATSTPFPDSKNPRSETALIYPESRVRKFSHLYDFQSRKQYFKRTMKPLPPDLFLKPLPGENFYKRGILTRCLDVEPYRHYSVDGLARTSDYKNSECDSKTINSEPCVSILKKYETESGDKHSTSSAESIKDIKIYQSGGILIMQNFKDNFDVNDKREQISDFSAKLIENCNKLKEEIAAGLPNVDEKPMNSSDELKNSGKTVQFDLSGCENHKSKSGDSSSNVASFRIESSESMSDFAKSKDTSPQGTSQSQDFGSLSTQENDSILSNLPGTSPTFGGSGKKLEWDSGADVGYLNLDLSKENLSTIERIVLKGLSSDGLSEKKVIYEKKPDQPQTNRSKFVLERMPSELVIEEVVETKKKSEGEVSKDEKKYTETTGDVEVKNDVTQSKVEKMISSEDGFKGQRQQQQQQPDPPSKSRQKPAKGTTRNAAVSEDANLESQIVELADKSTNVNTLFEDEDNHVSTCSRLRHPDIRPTESSSKIKRPKVESSKVKKLKKKNNLSQRASLTGPLKEKIDSIIDLARNSSRSIEDKIAEMGIPKVYRKLEGSPELNELELSREVDEIIIDQRFKIKQNVSLGRGDRKETAENVETGEKKGTSRPISGSSSSNNTVLQNSQVKTKREKSSEKHRFANQMIQTNDAKVESVGIQAFSSQKSSICDLEFPKKDKPEEDLVRKDKEGVNTSSKNIQAFGLNASLPRQLAHPKESKMTEPQNTKSTQFFGGPINSLPNYHSNVVTKAVESCGHVTKVLKPKKNVETEVIRLNEENRKNILANDTLTKRGETNKDTENKENLITEVTSNSKKSNEPSQESVKKDTETRAKKKSERKKGTSEIDSTGLRCSDEVSSNVLTSEILREHGGSIDRNIIQEKYFQSQMIEFEKKEMVSKSTSMERQLEHMGSEFSGTKNCATVGCQYSPKENTSEEGSKRSQDRGSRGERSRKNGRKEVSEQYDSSQNMDERFGTLKSINKEQDFGTGDSLPSSTQTAHSWIPGMQNSNPNEISGVGRARSFEYLPGHIYESSGNLREELPSETEQNLITGSSSGSSFGAIGDVGKGSTSDGLKGSEGRHTLVLENSNETAQDSGRMKMLDENLTQLDLVVTKLWEKDDQIQCITQSLLVNIRKEMGSGDCSEVIEGTDTPKTEVIDNQDSFESLSGRDETNDLLKSRKTIKGKEFSIACQTEEKLCDSDNPERFYEERKALEKRISQEKESQIKWIENEIHHLNLLRGLLEKQSISSQRRKKNSALTITSGDVSSPEKDFQSPKSILEEVCRRSIHCSPIPVEDESTENELPILNEENFKRKKSKNFPRVSDVSKYGKAVTLTGGVKNLRRVVMLPVGVQVTMKDKDCKCSDVKSSSKSPKMVVTNVDTQCPRIEGRERSTPSTSTRGVMTECVLCEQKNCVCLNLSGKSEESMRRSSQDKSKTHSKCQRPNSVNKSDTENSSTEGQMSDLEKYGIAKESQRTLGRSRSGSTTEPDISDAERYRKDYDRRQSNSSGVLPVVHSQPQNVICRCESHSKHTTSQDVKTACHSYPNVYVNCEKCADKYGSCHCSKVQVQRGSNSFCHVIKIHGSKCSSSVNGGCSCRKQQSFSKKMENQFSQTDDVVVLEKKCAEPVREPEVIYPLEERLVIESELKETMEEKLAVSPKIPFESRNPCSNEIDTKDKVTVPKEVKEPGASAPCQCQQKKNKEKPKQDDHPRHYFLKIEETEVDDLNESIEERKTLEVITVTVPVKKAGKSKVYGKKIIQSSISNQCSVESFNGIRTGCNCCKTCIGRACKESQKTTRRSPTNVYWRSSDSFEDDYKDVSHPSLSSQECYPSYDVYEKGVVRPTSSSETKQYTIKSWQSDHYSHKERHREKSESLLMSNGRCHNDKKEQERSCQRCGCRCPPNECANTSSESRIQRPPSSDYYNYNKKEFMTKSELLKEEKKKQGKHQPSLQECLVTNRPDFYSSAENRRQIISEKAKERVKRHNNRMECLINLIHQCDGMEQSRSSRGPKRIFTTSQMREQTMKRYKRLPEVTGRVADQKKKEEYKTNKLMADIFAKKLQLKALKVILRKPESSPASQPSLEILLLIVDELTDDIVDHLKDNFRYRDKHR